MRGNVDAGRGAGEHRAAGRLRGGRSGVLDRSGIHVGLRDGVDAHASQAVAGSQFVYARWAVRGDDRSAAREARLFHLLAGEGDVSGVCHEERVGHRLPRRRDVGEGCGLHQRECGGGRDRYGVRRRVGAHSSARWRDAGRSRGVLNPAGVGVRLRDDIGRGAGHRVSRVQRSRAGRAADLGGRARTGEVGLVDADVGERHVAGVCHRVGVGDRVAGAISLERGSSLHDAQRRACVDRDNHRRWGARDRSTCRRRGSPGGGRGVCQLARVGVSLIQRVRGSAENLRSGYQWGGRRAGDGRRGVGPRERLLVHRDVVEGDIAGVRHCEPVFDCVAGEPDDRPVRGLRDLERWVRVDGIID